MIKASELRIGNWVKYLNEWQYVQSIDLYYVNLQGNLLYTELEKLDPIELTPEILLKAGFELKSTLLDYCKVNVSIRQKEKGYEVAWYHSTIEYLHQLQNLYFSLTNEELTITL